MKLKTLLILGIFMLGLSSLSQAAILKLDANVIGGIYGPHKQFKAMWLCHKNTSKHVKTVCQLAVGEVGDSPLIPFVTFKQIRANAGNADQLKKTLQATLPRYTADLTADDINTLVELFNGDKAVIYLKLHREAADISFNSTEVSVQNFNAVEITAEGLTNLFDGLENQVEDNFGEESPAILQDVVNFVSELKK